MHQREVMAEILRALGLIPDSADPWCGNESRGITKANQVRGGIAAALHRRKHFTLWSPRLTAYILYTSHSQAMGRYLRDFKLHIDSQDSPSHNCDSRSKRESSSRTKLSQSEHDWAIAKRALARGDDPQEVIRFERPGPQSVSPATYCSGVEVVVWWRWIVDMRAPFLGDVTLRCVTASSKISV
jgi:hypothetical protein